MGGKYCFNGVEAQTEIFGIYLTKLEEGEHNCLLTLLGSSLDLDTS